MKISKKGNFEFIDFKTGNEAPRNNYAVNDHQQIDSQLNEFNQNNQQINQQINNQINSISNQIRISPFNIKQNMPFCYANYSMMNNHQPNWNSDEENSLKNKKSDSMVTQMITVDCGDSTTTSSTASSCSLPANEGSDKPINDYESFKPLVNLPAAIKITAATQCNKLKSTNLLNTIDNQNNNLHQFNLDKKSSLAPLTLEWTNLSCEISTRKSFLSNAFNCFITNERANIYNNSESSSLNDLNRDSEASSYQLAEQMFRNKKKGKKLILDKQSGQFKSGSINGIIGASGAGKSTLLECISGRRLNGVEGTVNVYANTEIYDKSITLAYLGQTEALINVLTVKEVLLFASRLKNYRKFTLYEHHLKLVTSIVKEFKLECCENNYIYNISGGQLKRVAIAAELISGPGKLGLLLLKINELRLIIIYFNSLFKSIHI